MGDVIDEDDVVSTFDLFESFVNMNALIITDPENYLSGFIAATPQIWSKFCLAREVDTCY